MSCCVILTDHLGYRVALFLPCIGPEQARERAQERYPHCAIESIECTEAAHA